MKTWILSFAALLFTVEMATAFQSLGSRLGATGLRNFGGAKTSVLTSNLRSIARFSGSSVLQAKKCVNDLNDSELKGKRVFVRTDFNVPLSKGDKPEVTDDTRLRGALPTINYLTERGAKVILASHLGRPDGKKSGKYSMSHVTPKLSSLVGKPVTQLDEVIGPTVNQAVSKMNNGDIVMLENVRFHAEEEKNDDGFSAELAKNADVYVNDAFGTAHRAHASTAGVAKHVKTAVSGFLLQKELQYLQGVVENPTRPFVAIVGGSKVSSKISVIESLLNKVDKLVLGGGMVFTFLKARGYEVGDSLVENDQLDLARSLEQKAKTKGVQLILATDVVVADKFDKDANHKIVKIDAIPSGWSGLDIGPDSIKHIQAALKDAKTVIWNGPMGVFEFPAFAKGTNAIAHTLADLTRNHGAVTVVGGGDSVAAVEQAKLGEFFSHISTGGGASLELLEGKVLPGVAVLNEK